MRIRMPKQLMAAKPATCASSMQPALALMCLVSCETSLVLSSHGQRFTPEKKTMETPKTQYHTRN